MSQARENVKRILALIAAEYPQAEKRLARDKREPKRKEKHELEQRMMDALQRMFRRQLRKLKDKLTQYNPDRKALMPPIDEVLDEDDIPELIKIIFNGLLGGIELYAEGLTFDFDWTLTNSRALDAARKYAFELIQGINATSKTIVQNAITGFIETPGMTIGDVMEQILSAGFSEGRIERIAVTEVTRAYAQGEMQAGRELKAELGDVKVTKTWLTNMDDRTCEVCMQNENEEVEIDEAFSSGDMEPPAHVNCRCWLSTRTRING